MADVPERNAERNEFGQSFRLAVAWDGYWPVLYSEQSADHRFVRRFGKELLNAGADTVWIQVQNGNGPMQNEEKVTLDLDDTAIQSTSST